MQILNNEYLIAERKRALALAPSPGYPSSFGAFVNRHAAKLEAQIQNPTTSRLKIAILDALNAAKPALSSDQRADICWRLEGRTWSSEKNGAVKAAIMELITNFRGLGTSAVWSSSSS